MQLKKELNLLDVFCITSGAMISSGIFILPGMAYALAGPAVVLSYLLAGLFAITGVLSKAELVSAMPRSGGIYFYVTRSMGPAIGTINGLVTWLSLSLKSAFALVGMAAFLKVFADINIHITATLLCIVFIIINIVGIKEASKVQVVLVLGIFLILLFYIILGVPEVAIKRFEPFAPNGLGAIFSTTGFIFISYGGLLKVASIAEEVKDPGRVIPLGMIYSLLIVTIFYILVVFVTAGTLNAAELGKSLTPISDGAFAFMGTGGRAALSIAAIFAFISTANAGLMAASRFPFSMSRDGLLPGFLWKINRKYKTPHVSILATGILMIVSLFLKLRVLIELASTVFLLTFIFANLSVIILRESRLQNYQPKFKTPFYPWVQIIGTAGSVFFIFEMGAEALFMSIFLIIGGFIIYWFYGRARTEWEYALLHLIERITADELTTHSLETELKLIIQERDEIVEDKFDELIKKGIVLDIEKPLGMEEFFQIAAKTLSEKIGVSEDIVLRKLSKREEKGSAVISPGIAVPHIIIDGQKKCNILLVRCKEGIKFAKDTEKVNAVFILIGTRDERNFHLRALSAIAQIIQDQDFEKKWLEAKSKEALRDIIILGERKRHNTKK